MTEQHVEDRVRAHHPGRYGSFDRTWGHKTQTHVASRLTRPGAMNRTGLKRASATGHRLSLSIMRRRTWKPRKASSTAKASMTVTPKRKAPLVAGEFEAARQGFAQKFRRCPGLASDILLLILASPIFAAWWGFRLARRAIYKKS